MSIKIFSIAILSLFIHGCAYFSSGYTPLNSLKQYHEVNAEQKFDVTYSVNYFSHRSDVIGVASKAELIKEISKKLKKTGLFSKVNYVENNKKSPYHFSFTVMYGMPSTETAIGISMLSGYTFFIVPTWLTFSCDMIGQVYLNEQPKHSVAIAEINRVYLWLPLAPIGTVWNFWFSWDYVENKLENFIINDISQYHYAAFTQKDEKNNIGIQDD